MSDLTTRHDEKDTDYEAVLVVSFGGPEGINDVMPFLENVLRGRNVPAERIRAVARHYEMFGGVSPINSQNRQLIAALKRELEKDGPQLPIYFGNRNWQPFLPDTLAQMSADGIKRALAFVTSAYSSYSSCRQYLGNISDARAVVGENAPEIHKIRAFFNHPLFIEANVAHARAALDQIQEPRRSATPIVFTAHSIPQTMADNCDYEAQLLEVSHLVANALGEPEWQLVYQSRSGSPAQPWLGPDICEHLQALRKAGVRDVVVCPIGFVSDHMEIIYDLDIEARQLCEEIGLNMVRAATPGIHPAFITMVRELIVERCSGNSERRFIGTLGPRSATCAVDCCLPGF